MVERSRNHGVRATARLLLRSWAGADREEMARLCSDPEVMRFISRGRRLGSEEVDEIVGQSLEMWERLGFGPWAAIEKATGRWIGRIGLNELAWWPGPHMIEVGFELHREFWNQGFATARAF